MSNKSQSDSPEEITEEELERLKILADFLFFDQYKNVASYPRFQKCFAAFVKDKKMKLFPIFKEICGEKRKYITLGRLINSLINSKNEENGDSETKKFFDMLLSDEMIREDHEETGEEYEHAIHYSTRQGHLRHFISKICVITDESGEIIKGLQVFYDDFFKNDLFLNKRGQKFKVALEMTLNGDLTKGQIDTFPDMNTKDGVTHIFGTYTDYITFIGFKARSGKTYFYGKPMGIPFIYGGIGKHLKTISCQVNEGRLSAIEPGFVDVIRKNSYVDKTMDDIDELLEKCNDCLMEENTLENINDPIELDKNIKVPCIPDDYFFDKNYEDKIKGTDIMEILEGMEEDDPAIAETKLKETPKFEFDEDKLLEEAEMFSKYKNLRDNLNKEKEEMILKGDFDAPMSDPNGNYESGNPTTNLKGITPQTFLNNPVNYDNLIDDFGTMIEKDLPKEEVKKVEEKESEENWQSIIEGKLKGKVPVPSKKEEIVKFFHDVKQSYYNIPMEKINDDEEDKEIQKVKPEIKDKLKSMSKKAKETLKKKDKRAQDNWILLKKKLNLLTGVGLLKTIGAIIRSMNVLKSKKLTNEMPQEEKVKIYKFLKDNRPIIKLLSKAHMESLRKEKEEEELEQQREDLKKHDLPDPKELMEEEKKRQQEINEKADNFYKIKPKVLNSSDLPEIESKLKKLYEMKDNEKEIDKDKKRILEEYVEELQRDKNAILETLGKKGSKRILERIQSKFTDLVQKYEKERKVLELKDITILKKKQENDAQNLIKKVKSKLVSLKTAEIPKDIKIFKDQKIPKNNIFIDDEFKPIKESLCPLKENGSWNIPEGIVKSDLYGWDKFKWTPVEQIFQDDNFQVINTQIKPENIIQGELGNCYFLTAIAALCKHPHIIEKLFLIKEKSKEHCYGIYIKIGGLWKLVLLDDFIPFFNDSEGRMRFVFSSSYLNELWVILLEKAWAKISGCYANTIEGTTSEVFDAFSDGTTESFTIFENDKDDIYELLKQGKEDNDCMTVCASKDNTVADVGLVPGRNYLVEDVKEIEGVDKLIRLKNLWGNGDEWSGNWSNQSRKWTDKLAKEFDVDEDNDKNEGKFWISINDFVKYFIEMTICHINEDFENTNIIINKKIVTDDDSPHVTKMTVHNDDSQVYVKLNEKSTRVPLKDGTYSKPALNYIVITDTEGNFISGSHLESAYNATMANLNKGTYFILTDENHRFLTKSQTYVINVSSNEKVDLEEDNEIDGKELLRSAVIDYMKLYIIPKSYKGGRLHLMNISNELPFLGILFDNEKGKQDVKLKFEMNKVNGEGVEYYLEENNEPVIRTVPVGENYLFLGYPQSYNSDFKYSFKSTK